MNTIKDIISNNNFEIILGLIIVVLVLFVLSVISQFRISLITKKYNKLVKNTKAETLEDIILKNLRIVDEVRMQLDNIENYCNALDEKLKFCIQKVGFIRYNAFNQLGNDLSFSIALMDENNNGFVITSIYGRDESNTYAKSIINGKSKNNLSAEEMQAIDRAMKNNYFA